ncbi:MAG: DUF5329 domain-containing protein [Gammaproteobacteria bacterium]|nr:DUF5329 domain-containing protein [Gammaproteobacteria bacterium]
MTRKLVGPFLCLLSLPSMAGNAETEILFLLESIGQSPCVFIRNGKIHDAPEAESHLRMKYGKAKFWIDSSEKFIDRIASKSSWSGKPYFIDCPDADPEPAANWLSQKLATHRKEI